MLSRRSFIAASCVLATCRVTEAAESLVEVLKWLFETAKLAVPSLDQILATALKVVTDVNIFRDIRTRIGDIRRKLTDSTPEHHLDVRLTEWLKHYDMWVNETATPGESNTAFAARHEHARVILQDEWKACTLDAVGAMQEIENLGIELESVDPSAMSFAEWHAYKRLLEDEKMVIGAIKADMPTEPGDIEKVRDIAKQLDQIVIIIDKRAADLDQAIQSHG